VRDTGRLTIATVRFLGLSDGPKTLGDLCIEGSGDEGERGPALVENESGDWEKTELGFVWRGLGFQSGNDSRNFVRLAKPSNLACVLTTSHTPKKT
jgi:hypothetical protein